MHVPRVSCPRCDRELQQADLRGVRVTVCAGCQGTLVPQTALTPLLEALRVDLLQSFDLDAKLSPAPQARGRTACPGCRQRMDSDDYCAAGLVRFDRCNACQILWLDSSDLGTMTMMWARMNRRQAHHRDVISAGAVPVPLRGPTILMLDPSRLGYVVWGVLGAAILSW